MFLSFVSNWGAKPTYAESTQKVKDEFAIFEQEQEQKPKKPEPLTPITSSANQKKVVVKETSEQKIERLKKEIVLSPKNFSLVFQLGKELYAKNEYEKVTSLLWNHVENLDRQGLILLANAHKARNEPSDSLRALNILIGKDDKDFEAHCLMGDAYLKLKKNKDAVESYKKSIDLNSKYEPAYLSLISMYEKRNPPNLYELRILYQDLIQSIGSRPQYLRKLCEINTLDATYEPAIQMCKDAIVKDSKVAEPYVYLGIAYREIGETELANSTLKKASLDFPKSELAQYHYAKQLEEQKNYIDAMKLYKVGTDADPSSSRSWLGLATTSFEIKKFEISLIAYKTACKLDKKNAVAFRKATATLRNQKNSQWVSKFEQASETCTF